MLRLAIIIILALSASLVSWGILNSTYSYDAFASEEAQASLEVTEAQTVELLASRRTSDVLAFGLFGALLGLVCGAACNPTATMKSALIASLVGILGGAIAGTASAYLAHWHDANIAFPRDPMIYWFVRWALILIPIGVAGGIAGQIAGKSKRGMDGVIGGMIGAAVAVILYCLASGSLTPIESHHEIFPAHSTNRLLAFTLAGICIAVSINLQLGRNRIPNAKSGAEEATTTTESP